MVRQLKTVMLGGFAVVLAVVAIGATGVQTPHVMATLGEAQWGPAPPLVPAGAQISVLSGDPTKPGPYTVRFKFPANYDIPAHSHPGDENVAVTSGELFMGMGDKLDRTRGNRGIPVGGYAFMPKNMNHFAFTKVETTLLLYGIGPVDFKYVNPSDDPRSQNSAILRGHERRRQG